MQRVLSVFTMCHLYGINKMLNITIHTKISITRQCIECGKSSPSGVLPFSVGATSVTVNLCVIIGSVIVANGSDGK